MELFTIKRSDCSRYGTWPLQLINYQQHTESTWGNKTISLVGQKTRIAGLRPL